MFRLKSDDYEWWLRIKSSAVNAWDLRRMRTLFEQVPVKAATSNHIKPSLVNSPPQLVSKLSKKQVLKPSKYCRRSKTQNPAAHLLDLEAQKITSRTKEPKWSGTQQICMKTLRCNQKYIFVYCWHVQIFYKFRTRIVLLKKEKKVYLREGPKTKSSLLCTFRSLSGHFR